MRTFSEWKRIFLHNPDVKCTLGCVVCACTLCTLPAAINNFQQIVPSI